MNELLGRLFSQYYNLTFVSLIDPTGNIIDLHIHKTEKKDMKKKAEEIIKKALDFKAAASKAASILGYDTSKETFFKGDSHIVITYEIDEFLVVMLIEMSKPLIDSFDFEKYNDKLEMIIIELKKKIDKLKADDNSE